MKKADKVSLHQKSSANLQTDLNLIRRRLVEAQSKIALSQAKDTSTVRKLKYQIALISTLINQKSHES